MKLLVVLLEGKLEQQNIQVEQCLSFPVGWKGHPDKCLEEIMPNF